MIYVMFIYAFLKLYIILDIYQQSHYHIKEYFIYFIKRFWFYDLFILLALIIGLYSNINIIEIISAIFIVGYSILYFFVKVRLNFSHRVIRLIIMSIIYLAIVASIKYVGYYILLFDEFSLILIFIIEDFYSKIVNRRFITLAKNKINNFTGNKIIITGSYGKTSTKRLFNQILNVYSKSICTPKSYNTILGISKFLNENHISSYDNVVLEYGASQPNDIKKLCSIAKPDIAVICEIGYMHMNGFKDINNVIEEKMSLIEDAKIVILNYDNQYIRNYEIKNKIVLSYGLEYGDYQARNITNGSFDFYYLNKFLCHFDTNLNGIHQILNLLAPLSYIHYLGYDLNRAIRVAKLLEVESNRLEIKKYKNSIVLDDSFNSNVKGFINALKLLGGYDGKKILITPGIVELGKYEGMIYLQLVDHIVSNCNVVILVGYYTCKSLYQMLRKYNIELYVVNSFKEGYQLYKAICKKEAFSIVLIENDLPDIYKRGLEL